jgi:hypothetical protein
MPDPLEPTNPFDPKTGPPSAAQRYNGASAQAWKCWQSGIVADQEAPTDINGYLRSNNAKSNIVRWTVFRPDDTPGCVLHVGRLVLTTLKDPANTVLGMWVEEGAYPMQPGSPAIIDQYIDGDPVGAYIDGILGTPADPGYALLFKQSAR